MWSEDFAQQTIPLTIVSYAKLHNIECRGKKDLIEFLF
ncbi:uncharacterized protein METZ01_LOCUS93046, partial [marine metagenome]